MSDCLYDREGERFAPREWAGGPWSAETQHGGSVNALFMEGAESAARERGLHVARLTVDLFRPVPMAPLERRLEVVREGRRIAAVALTLAHDGEPVAGASALLLRPADAPPVGDAGRVAPGAPGDEPGGAASVAFIPPAAREQLPPGFHWSLEIRMAGSDDAPAAWITTPLDFSEGVALSPAQRLAAVADLTFGLGGRMQLRREGRPPDGPRASFINADTTLYLERVPEGAWFSLEEPLTVGHDGVGVANVVLGDVRGRVGHAAQALLAQRFRLRG